MNRMKNICLNLKSLWMIAVMAVIISCERNEDNLQIAEFPAIGEVFIDEFSATLDWGPFLGSKQTALEVVDGEGLDESAVLRFEVPDPEDLEGSFLGGVLHTSPRNLTDFTALTFWARSSVAGSINEIGFGLDDSGADTYRVTVNGLTVTPVWRKYVIPIPNASLLTEEEGMFWIAEGAEASGAYLIWIDDLQFENFETITPTDVSALVGQITYDINGNAFTLSAASAYFNPDDYVFADTPDKPADKVVSIFSDAYEDQAGFNPAAFNNGEISVNEITVGAESVVSYSNNLFVGVGWDTPLDLSENADRKFLHVDVYVTQPIGEGENLGVEIIDYGPDGVDTGLSGGDDTAGGTTLAGTTLQEGAWVGIDLPISGFSSPTGGGGAGNPNLANVARIAFIGAAGIQNIVVDNIYFWEGDVLTEPDVAAPTPPTRDEADVISLFSDAYTDVPVSTFRTPWSGGSDLSDVMIDGNAAKRYDNVTFWGVETVGENLLDLSGMTHVHIDIWTPGTEFGMEIVSFGDDGGFDGGDDTKHRIARTPTAREWTQIDTPLSEYLAEGLGQLDNIAQYVFTLVPNGQSVWIDNFYFYNDGTGGNGNTSPYCDTQIEHFPGVPGSEALLSITQVTRVDGFPALKFTIKADPTNGKVPDVLVLNSFEGGNGLEPVDNSVSGEISQQVFWPSGAPPNNETTFQVLWSFENEPEQWQLFETPTTKISLDVTCD